MEQEEATLTKKDWRVRVTVNLDRRQLDKLEQIGKDALFSVGTKLPRNALIAALVELLVYLDIRGEGITHQDHLYQRLFQAWAKKGGR